MIYCSGLVDSYHWAIQWVRQLSHVSVPAEAVVQSRPALMRFVVDKLALKYSSFLLSGSFHPFSTHIDLSATDTVSLYHLIVDSSIESLIEV